SLNAQNPDLYPNTNWRGLILNNSAPRQSHNISITAGTKAIRTKASLAYDKTDALYDARTYERLTARFNNDITINNYLSATVDFNFKRTISKQPVVDPMYKMGIAPPIYAALWSDGRIGAGKDGANIYGQMKYGGSNDNYYNAVGGKISVDFTPLTGLKFSGVVSPTYNFDKGKKFSLAIPYTAYNNPGTVSGYLEGAKETALNEVRNDSYRVTYQLLANYTHSFGQHNLYAMAGYEYYYAFNENLGASRGQYTLNSYPYLNIGPLILRDNSGDAYENAYRSYFGRIMYNYQNKYFLQGNIRYDGSSRFYKDYRWGSFPSFSAGWVMSEESFMKPITALSFLKIRGSWGTLGNERIGNYPYQAALNFETNSLFYQGNTAVSAQSAAQWQYAIRDISWEKTESFDFGLDANLFNNKLRFTGDYYHKTTRDMLLQLQIPMYLGFDNPNQNTGKMNTKGWEFEIGWNDKIGDLDYSVSANLSDFKSVMGDLGGTEFLGDQIKRKGSEFNEWYGYVSEGLYQTQADVDASAKLNANVRPGDVRYKDISGPSGVPDGKISPEYDRILLGGSLPRYMYGANISLGYKNFDFSVVFQGIGDQNVRLNSTMVQPLLENYGNFPAILDGKYWSRYNTEAQNLVARYPRFTNTSAGNNYVMSDFWLFNGAYLRLKNITLGYNVPKSVTGKVKLQGVRVYATVSDLFSVNNYPKGWDPEMSSSAYPITTSFIFGASIKF
ncbi:MAG TPA: SusC/RagA family TonB-linked outer membrane protein, partial [Prolixibacteraceae bacterium]